MFLDENDKKDLIGGDSSDIFEGIKKKEDSYKDLIIERKFDLFGTIYIKFLKDNILLNDYDYKFSRKEYMSLLKLYDQVCDKINEIDISMYKLDSVPDIYYDFYFTLKDIKAQLCMILGFSSLNIKKNWIEVEKK